MKPNLDNLISLFDKMHVDGFDTSNTLLWGFYFVDKNPEKLRNLFNELSTNGYQLVYLKENDEQEWTLYVNKVDILSPEKLHRRNIAFNELAIFCDVSLYDGWDVEK